MSLFAPSHVYFVGVHGPIGGLLAFHLRRNMPSTSNITVIRRNSLQMDDFVGKQNGAVHVTKDGVRRAAYGFLASIPNPSQSARRRTNRIPENPIDILFMSTRTFSAKPMLSMLKSRLNRSSTVVMLQNGLGVYDDVVKELFTDPATRPHFVIASHSHRVYQQGVLDFIHTHSGKLEFSVLPNDPYVQAEAGFHNQALSPFDRAGRVEDIIPPKHPHPERLHSLATSVQLLKSVEELNPTWLSNSDLQVLIRERLVIDSIVDPLTAVMRCTNGYLLTTDYARHIISNACNEASKIFQAELNQSTRDTAGKNWTPSMMRALPDALHPRTLESTVMDYLKDSPGQMSQMLSDVRKGKPTEVNHLTGRLLKLATDLKSEAKIPVPTLRVLYNLVGMRSSIPLDQNM
ncbi:6-phosphogluconate dehydrogenase C-terminal domain-like protein [Cylindrobasidium torrendii FP15055 ss-10]|uniref:6-phosphogluconate dehydrogenase C-terminal domain-like protein n=1 Tax=Cylindrobasidium torrendii FP15055 ss-10 TaxID=1314674 RepID=A0A0D7B9H1_9AGAR|nr:6-phosphogluconate dehydrogenase C-terminal domain-like protein [Cylindrobasidium torrendii FP15055 ss-10]